MRNYIPIPQGFYKNKFSPLNWYKVEFSKALVSWSSSKSHLGQKCLGSVFLTLKRNQLCHCLLTNGKLLQYENQTKMLKTNADIFKTFFCLHSHFSRKRSWKRCKSKESAFPNKTSSSFRAPSQTPVPYSSAGNSSPTGYDLYFGSASYSRSLMLVAPSHSIHANEAL